MAYALRDVLKLLSDIGGRTIPCILSLKWSLVVGMVSWNLGTGRFPGTV